MKDDPPSAIVIAAEEFPLHIAAVFALKAKAGGEVTVASAATLALVQATCPPKITLGLTFDKLKVDVPVPVAPVKAQGFASESFL
ncbi:hypothetical protein D3C80_1464450 [compost metagenome]